MSPFSYPIQSHPPMDHTCNIPKFSLHLFVYLFCNIIIIMAGEPMPNAAKERMAP